MVIFISRRENRLPTATLTVGSSTVSPMPSVHDLGIFVDSDLVMRRCVRRCRAALLHCVSCAAFVTSSRRPSFSRLLIALVLSRLDYGNGTLIGLPIHLIRRLQSVQTISSPPLSTCGSLHLPEGFMF